MTGGSVHTAGFTSNKNNKNDLQRLITDSVRRLAQSTLALSAAATLLHGNPALAADSSAMTFPVASRPEIFGVQRTMVEAWKIVNEA
jgi:hypothetical protein